MMQSKVEREKMDYEKEIEKIKEAMGAALTPEKQEQILNLLAQAADCADSNDEGGRVAALEQIGQLADGLDVLRLIRTLGEPEAEQAENLEVEK
jgi:hypothetical protein